MPALRCSLCGTSWPNDSHDFGSCPECEHPTSYMQNADAIETAEARSRKAHADFERYYTRTRLRAQVDELIGGARDPEEPVHSD